MADIFHELTVQAPVAEVYRLFSTAAGLEKWWTKTSTGDVRESGEFRLYFGPDYDWRAKVTKYLPLSKLELQVTHAHSDWMGTRVGCELIPEGTQLAITRFRLPD